MNRVYFASGSFKMNWTSRPFHRASCLILRNEGTQNSQAGCWPEEVEVPRGESLGVRCPKNTTGSVGSCGASGAFWAHRRAAHCFCLSLWFSLSACLSPVCLPALPQHKAVLVQRRARCTESLCVSPERKNTLYAKKTSTSHGNAHCIDSATCRYKVTLLFVWNW